MLERQLLTGERFRRFQGRPGPLRPMSRPQVLSPSVAQAQAFAWIQNSYVVECDKPTQLDPLPGQKDPVIFPCGKCALCLDKRRSAFGARIWEETLWAGRLGQASTFFTLTYSDEHVPKRADGTMVLDYAQAAKFRRRLRDHLRYIGWREKLVISMMGEYSPLRADGGNRPHFHGVLYGIEPNMARMVLLRTWPYCSPWALDVQEMTPNHAHYLANYVAKRVEWDPDDDRPKEKLCQSNGIGAAYACDWLDLQEKYCPGQCRSWGDVPSVITMRIGRKKTRFTTSGYQREKMREHALKMGYLDEPPANKKRGRTPLIEQEAAQIVGRRLLVKRKHEARLRQSRQRKHS